MTTFKIFGVGKGTSKTYTSFDDAEQAIKVNKIVPHIGNDSVIIEKTTVTEFKIKVEIPTLCIDNKKFLIEYVKKKLTVKNINGRLRNLAYEFYRGRDVLFSNKLKAWAISEYSISDEEISEALRVDKFYESTFFKRLEKDWTTMKNGYVHCIKQLFDEIDINKFEFTCNVTDYKPCHNILIELPDTDFALQIRIDNFVVNEGSCYGRNMHLRSTYTLHDGNFDKWCKDLNIK